MGLKYYQNSKEILKSTIPVRAEYLNQADLDILTYEYASPTVNTHVNRKIELHIYDITGNKMLSMYDVSSQIAPTYITPTAAHTSYIDIHHLFTDVGFLSGQYKVFFNFLQNVIGSSEGNKLVISEISPSRKEIRLKPQHQDGHNLNQIFIDQVPALEGINEYCILLNFGNNNILQAINWAVEKSPTGQSESILIKLYEPLPVSYELLTKCWVVGEVSLPYVDTISLVGETIGDLGGNIQGPNFEIDVDFQLNQGSNGFKTWNDLLGSGLQTSQQIVDSYFSGSLHGMKLNICYCEFDSFVHFSSAEERIKNFRYKLQLIEQYDSKLVELDNTVGSVGDNTVLTTRRRNEVISGFDDFENYLYFQSGSLPYTFGSCSIDPWPKQDTSKVSQYITWVQASQQWNQQNSQWVVGGAGTATFPPEKPYVLYPVNSDTAKTYYNSLIASASIFDRFNDHALVKAIPLHISEKDTNSEALTFVNMMGHHFDILWTYVNYLNQIIYRKENPADCEAMSCDMLYHVADSMGWKLTHGKLNSDLWEYTLGVSEVTGEAQTTGSMGSKSAKEITCEVWRRTVNNLPHLLKTKGTSRSVKALLACYGIPQTMLSIKEYGGPKPSLEEKFPVFIKDTFKYALEFDGSTKYVTSPWVKAKINSYRTPDTIELRIRTRDSKKNHVTGRQTILQASSSNPPFFVTLEKSGSSAQKGNAYFYLSGSGGYLTASIQDEYLFDGNWANIMVRRKPTLTYQTSSDDVTQDNTYSFYLKKHKYGKLTTNASASITVVGSTSPTYNQAWQNGSTLYVGYGNNSDNTTYFSGSMQELRYWTSPLDEEDFDNHVTSPSAYDGNTITSSYDNLRFRIPMSQKQNLTTSASLMSQHPDQKILQFTSSIVASASFHNFVSSSDWNGFDEVYYIENPSLGGNNLWSEKVRLEDNTLRGYLSLNRSVEVSSYDTAPVDSNKLGIYFSPQNSINEDIYNQLGFFEIDDYIGDPRDVFKSDYPELTNLAYKYWRKYSDRNDFNEYLQILYQYDLSFFKQLQQLMPARVDLMDGILIEPNVLERSKEALYQIPVVEDLDYYANLGRIEEPTLSGQYPNYEADIDRVIHGITGSFDQQNGEIDLKTYEPTIYCYSGSTLGWSSSGSYIAMAGPSPASQCEIFSPIISQSRIYCNQQIVSGMSSSLVAGTEKVFFLPSDRYYETEWKPATTVTQSNLAYSISQFDTEIGDTNISWGGLNSISGSSDGLFASCSVSMSLGYPTNTASQSYYLMAYDFGHTLPDDAVVTGISARVRRKAGAAEPDPNKVPMFTGLSYEATASFSQRFAMALTIGKSVTIQATDGTTEIFTYRSSGNGTRDTVSPYGIKVEGPTFSMAANWISALEGTSGAGDSNLAGKMTAFVDTVDTSGRTVITCQVVPGFSGNSAIQNTNDWAPNIVASLPATFTGGVSLFPERYIGVSDYRVTLSPTSNRSSQLTASWDPPDIGGYWENYAHTASFTLGYITSSYYYPAASSSIEDGNDPLCEFDWQYVTGSLSDPSTWWQTETFDQATTQKASFYIYANNFNFQLPEEAIVTGIRVELSGSSLDDTGGTHHINFNRVIPRRIRVCMSRSVGYAGDFNMLTSSNLAGGGATDYWPAYPALTLKAYGSVSSSWGLSFGNNLNKTQSLSAAQVNGSTFGTIYQADSTKGGTEAGNPNWNRINTIAMRISYECSGSVTNTWATSSQYEYYGDSNMTWLTPKYNQDVGTWETPMGGTTASFDMTFNVATTGKNITIEAADGTTEIFDSTNSGTTGTRDGSSPYGIFVKVNDGHPATAANWKAAVEGTAGAGDSKLKGKMVVDVNGTTVTTKQVEIGSSGNTIIQNTNNWDVLVASLPAIFTGGAGRFIQPITSMSFQMQTTFPIGSINTASIDSVETKVYYKITSSFPCGDIQEFLPEGQNDLKYKGSKMTSADWNIASPDTVDGTPVVSVHAANPNKFIVQPPGASGSISILGAPPTSPPAPLGSGNV